MATAPSPIFKHDCSQCRFLGTINYAGQWGDLYVCERSNKRMDNSLIFRISDNGPDYTSAPVRDVIHNREQDPLRMALTLYHRL